MNSTSAKMIKYCVECMQREAGGRGAMGKGMGRRMNYLCCILGFHGDRRFVSWSFAIVIANLDALNCPFFVFFIL